MHLQCAAMKAAGITRRESLTKQRVTRQDNRND